MDNKINISPLFYELVVTIIATAGVFFGTEFNIVAVLVLIVGSIKSCYMGLSGDINHGHKKKLVIVNAIMLLLASLMLFIAMGVYNGATDLLIILKVMSSSCMIKIIIDIFYTAWYNYINE